MIHSKCENGISKIIPAMKMYNMEPNSGALNALAKYWPAIISIKIRITVIAEFKKKAADNTFFWSSSPAWFTNFIKDVFTNACLINSIKEVKTKNKDHTPISDFVSPSCASNIVLTTPKIGTDSFCNPLYKAAPSQLEYLGVVCMLITLTGFILFSI